MPPVAIGDEQHVAMEVHRTLGLARGARGEADEADIISGRIACSKGGRRFAHERFEPVILRTVEIDNAPERRRKGLGFLHVFGQPDIAQAQRYLCLVYRIGEFLGAQERHGGDGDPACLHHR